MVSDDIGEGIFRRQVGLAAKIQTVLRKFYSDEISRHALLNFLDERLGSVEDVIEQLESKEPPEVVAPLMVDLSECFQDYHLALESLEEMLLQEEDSPDHLEEVVTVLRAADQRVRDFQGDFRELEEKLQRDFPLNDVG